jgi:penicillin-binding protein 1A
MFYKIIKILFLLGVICTIAISIWVFSLYNNIDKKHKLDSIIDFNPRQTSQIFDKHGELIANVYKGEHRVMVNYADIAPFVIEALIAAEDTMFFEHNGISINAIVRAIIKDLQQGSLVEGASTITQQLVRTSILSREKKIIRKINEVLLAIKLETTLSKEEILYRYFNKVYFGHRYYGIATASFGYYKKNLKNLNLKEIALLIGLVKAPSYYDPTKNYNGAIKRANAIVHRMKTLGWINQDEYINAIGFEPIIYDESISQNKAPYVVDYTIATLKKQIPNIRTGGYKIHLNIDLKAQILARKALRYGYSDIVGRMNLSTQALKDFVGYKELNMSLENVSMQYTQNNNSNLENLSNNTLIINTHKQFNETKALEKKLGLLNGAMIVTQTNGDILALVGGVNYKRSSFNRVTQSKRQPGSLIKPFVYLIALNSGYSINSPIADISRNYQYDKVDESANANTNNTNVSLEQINNTITKVWSPKNYANNYKGIITLKTALTKSINLATINLVSELGLKNVYKNLLYFGFKDIPKDMSIALGSFAISPFDISSQFSIFSNGGKKVTPKLINYVIDNKNNIGYFNEQAKFITTKEQAFLLTSVLNNVVNKGTGRKARQKNMQIAGKTGTTNKNKDIWFAGFSPDLQIVTWYGNDDNTPMEKTETGSGAPVRAFAYFHKRWSKANLEMKQEFDVPEGVYKTKSGESEYYFTDTSPAIQTQSKTKTQDDEVLF